MKLEEVYDFLYSLSFLTPRYKLQFGDNEIYRLSPGERGLLLLVFYLLIDKSDIPLVIDQPEENLDNQTIYEVLVNCLTEAKQRRQVIVVTHNPSVKKHFKLGFAPHPEEPNRTVWDVTDKTKYSHRIHELAYGQRKFDTDVFRARYEKHNADVEAYFRNRPISVPRINRIDSIG